MQLCIGTSLAIIVPTTVRSYFAHKAKGAVIPNVLRIWALPAAFGVAIGSLVAALAPASVFKGGIRPFYRLCRNQNVARSPELEFWNAIARAFGIERLWICYGTFFVSGWGERRSRLERRPYVLRALDAAGGSDVRRNWIPYAMAGTIGYMLAGWRFMPFLPPLSIGFVSPIGFALMAPASSYTASYGVRLAHRLPKRNRDRLRHFPDAGVITVYRQPSVACRMMAVLA